MTKGLSSKRRDTRVRGVRRLTAGLLHHCAPAWSPDGHVLCFTLGRGPDSHWLLTDRKGRAARVLEGPVSGGASVAADYSVAYGRQVGATAEIWILSSTGTPPQRLLGGDGRLYRDPAFSPDGRFLCYAADDGKGGSDDALRLWVMDLGQSEHTLLVADPPAIEGATGPIRIGRPAWSAGGDWVFFDVVQGEQSAVGMVEVATRKAQLLTEAGFGRPAPIVEGLLCVEQAHRDGDSTVCVLQYRAAPATGDDKLSVKLRIAALSGLAAGAHEPAVAVGKKGTIHLAWAAPARIKGGEPQRYDVHTGRLSRLPALRAPRPPTRPEQAEDAETAAADAGTVQKQSAAAAAGLSATHLDSAGASARRRPRKRKHEAGVAHELASHAVIDHDEAPADAERGV